MNFTKTLLLSAALCSAGALFADTNEFVVNTKKHGAPIQPTMYGIFFEDINYGADGGLYAEMIKNRSFEFPQSLMGWKTTGNVQVMNEGGPFDKNPHYVRMSYSGHRVRHTAIENEGYFGVSVKKGEKYRFSVWARCPEGGKSMIEVQICDYALDMNQHRITRAKIEIDGKEWKKYTAELEPFEDCYDGVLRIFLRSAEGKKPASASEAVVTDLEHVSLFPVDTWKGRENGMRKDLAQALDNLHPGVFRFPGGCIVEGTDIADRYNWKNTVGPVENRPLNINRWQFEFDYRFYPDYYQSYGLGFYEYFQLSEDFGAEPLPVIFCGLTCQYENDIKDEKTQHVALADLDPYIQDAVDLVEFANGGVDTKWGKLRADMGHPAPFGLKYLAVGNEQWDYEDNPAYTSRLRKFMEVLRVKCPEIKIIGTTGPNSEGWDFDLLQPRMKELGVDLYDEHYYRNEEWFLSHGLRYDSYDRKGPKIFAGEYACHGSGKYESGKEKKCNHFETSLYEAAHMTGIERNADIVHMATYAPLFAHVKGWQWRPDMIWFDNMRSHVTCSYYVQQLYSLYKGSNVLTLTMNKKPVAGLEGQNGLFASAVYDKNLDSYIVKVVNTSEAAQDVNIAFAGMKKNASLSSCRCIKLSSTDMDIENTLDNPDLIKPVESVLPVSGQNLSVTLEPKSFAVYLVK